MARRRRKQPKPSKKYIHYIFLSLLTIFVLSLIYLLLPTLIPRSSNASQTTVSSQSSSQASTQNTTTADSNSSTQTSSVNWVKVDEPVQIPILMYHAIHEMAPEEEANANLIVSPAVFESHLQVLEENGYYTLTPEEAYKVLTENVLPQDKKVVWLTFDDSIWDFYSYAYPLLVKYHMKATNNVITGFTENGIEGYLTLDQMKEMQANGMSFQGHTVNHPDLEVSSTDDQMSELIQSKNYLDSQLNQETIAVAYPSGSYSQDTLNISEQAGYKLGLTTNNGLASLADGLLSLNRVRVLPTTSAEGLLNEITP